MQVSDKQQLLTLIRSLAERTRSGALEWRRTGDPSGYLLVMKTGGVIVREYDEDESLSLDFQVLDKLGNELASMEDFETDEEVAASVRRLYRDVQANVPEPRHAIDALLRELEAASA